jgi:hypothetical protein
MGVTSRNHNRTIGRIALDIHSFWTSFMRAYYLSLFLEPSRIRRSKIHVTLPGLPEQDIWDRSWSATHKAGKPRPPNWEPWWFEVPMIIRLTHFFGATHQADIIAAFSLSTAVFTHLPAYRNYFAHRSPRSQREIRALQPQLGFPASLFPSSALISRPGTSTQPVLIAWISDLGEIGEALCT